jgi:chromosome segregation ATPase
MHLKGLEISGFKSFAKKSVLDFTAPISAIVGPNGSGKSNLTEAFRFVLGEQSFKSMRGKRGEDLIWNGSAGVPRANRASTKVVFDNSSHFLDIDFDEVSIERIVHRDGSNQYFINGSQVRLKDVAQLLASANIGASGHHIISQGEADRILNASPKDRREMIEDALGLKVFQYKKIESQKKLEKTQENIAQVQSLRKEIAPHLRFLGKQVERVEKALAMKDELKGLYVEYLKREDTYLKFHRNRLEEERRTPDQELAKLSAELATAKAVLEKATVEDERTKKVIELESELARVQADKDSITRDIGRLEGEIAAEQRRITREKERASQQALETVNLEEVRELSAELTVRLESAERSEELSVVKTLIREARDLLEKFFSRRPQQKAEDVEEDELEKLRARHSELQERLRECSETVGVLQRAHEAKRKEIEESKDEERAAERKIFSIMSRQNELQGVLNRLRNEMEKIEREEEEFKRELTEAAVLAGGEMYEYGMHTVMAAGREVTVAEIVQEKREAQEERRRIIERIKIRLEEFGSGSGEDIMKEYQEVLERDEFLQREIADLEHSVEALSNLIAELEEKLAVQFTEGLEKINEQFNHFFSLMFGGGAASLSLVKTAKRRRAGSEEEEDTEGEEEIEEGIEVTVSLPHKRIKGLVMLSGGERALTSIALLFAMSQVNPPPFVILDETDAALDEANSRKYGDLIENLSKYSQLILVTHNRETMSRAGILYGVTMGTDGVSKLLSVKFEEAVQVAK